MIHDPLPNEVKNAESLASFRRQLKTHLFKQAFLYNVHPGQQFDYLFNYLFMYLFTYVYMYVCMYTMLCEAP